MACFNCSIDMVRLKVKANKEFLNDFFSYYYQLSVMENIEYYQNTRINAFRHNFVFKNEEGSFWVGYEHNSENKHNYNTTLYVEYNPNKIKDNHTLNRILKSFFFDLNRVEVVSVDVAKDLNVDINNIFVDNKAKRTLKTFVTAKGKTLYLGEGDGRVKIYDKAKEQGIKGKLWTRFEVSLQIKRKMSMVGSYVLKSDLPVLKEVNSSLFISAELRAIFYALQDGVINFKDLSRRNKEHIRKMQDSVESITIEEYEVIQQLEIFRKLYVEKLKLINLF